jgi:hypothetical protein
MEMPTTVLIALVAGISAAVFFMLRPLKILSKQQFFISHGFIIIGLLIVLGWVWLNRDQFREATMIMGGIWTLFGGLCFVTVYVLRRPQKGS